MIKEIAKLIVEIAKERNDTPDLIRGVYSVKTEVDREIGKLMKEENERRKSNIISRLP